jgi:hypothetical protein
VFTSAQASILSSFVFNTSVKSFSDSSFPLILSTFQSSAFCVAVEIGLFKSLVFSTLDNHISLLFSVILVFKAFQFIVVVVSTLSVFKLLKLVFVLFLTTLQISQSFKVSIVAINFCY